MTRGVISSGSRDPIRREFHHYRLFMLFARGCSTS
jgi:hypothetical protein